MPSHVLHNERELLEQLATGDESAFDTIYWHYAPVLRRNLLKLVKSEDLADELLQEMFTRVWEKRAQISVHTGIGNYLFAASRNMVADMFRRIQKDKTLYQHVLNTATEHFYTTGNSHAAPDRMAMLNKAIESLPHTRARVFRLVKLEGKSYAEAGQLLGISTSTISDHIVKATRSIKTYLADHPHILEAIFLLSVFTGIKK